MEDFNSRRKREDRKTEIPGRTAAGEEGLQGVDGPKKITKKGSGDVKTYRRFPLCLPPIDETRNGVRREKGRDGGKSGNYLRP